MQIISGDLFSIPSPIKILPQEPADANPNLKSNSNPSLKKKRNLPGNPDPDAEVIALSPKTLMATNRFICEICNKGFQRDQNLQLHRRGHNLPWKLKQRSNKDQIRKKVYICPETTCVHHDASRALGDLTGIKKHFSRKHGEKKWKCEKCSKKYAVQSDWKAHSKTCGTREYKCDCGTLFSRKDSFITHRAFCDALAEESSRFSTTATSVAAAAANNMNFIRNDSLNESSTVINPHDQQPNLALGFTGLSEFGAGFRSDFTGNQHNSTLSLWLDQANSQLNPINEMPSAHSSNLYMPSSSNGVPDQMGNNNVFGTSSMGNSLYYGNNKSSGGQKPRMESPMSATALLQKAAQMGSTRSNPSVFGNSFGVMNTSSNSSSAINTTQAFNLLSSSQSRNDQFHQVFGKQKGENLGELLLPISSMSSSSTNHVAAANINFDQGMMQSRMRPVGGLFENNSSSLTRDFLGMGGEGGRPFLPQELAKFASFSSAAMGLSHFTSL